MKTRGKFKVSHLEAQDHGTISLVHEGGSREATIAVSVAEAGGYVTVVKLTPKQAWDLAEALHDHRLAIGWGV